jgi:hypothetical protein
LWIEALRIDPAPLVLGLRLNVWTSIIVFCGALAYLGISARLRPGRETFADSDLDSDSRPESESEPEQDAEVTT